MFKIICYAIIIILLLITWFTKCKIWHSLYLFIWDLIKMDKKKFRGFGFWLYCGLGGSGKTISMVEYLFRMRSKYPKLKIYTNFEFAFADGPINSWEDLINYDNGEDGIIFGFDEIHLTFASQNWQDCPNNFLDYISQQRKLHKQIVASSQVFTRIDKKLREQTNYVVECKSVFGCRWVFNRAFNTAEYLANNEKFDVGQKKRRRAWKHSFVATDRIRSLYNTMQVMKELSVPKSKQQQDVDSLIKKLGLDS